MGVRNLYQRFKQGLSAKRAALGSRFQTLRSKIHRPSFNTLRNRFRKASNNIKYYTRRAFSSKEKRNAMNRERAAARQPPAPTRVNMGTSMNNQPRVPGVNASTSTNNLEKNLAKSNKIMRRETLKQKRNQLVKNLKEAENTKARLLKERNEKRSHGENLHIPKKILKLPFYLQSNLNVLNTELASLNRELANLKSQ